MGVTARECDLRIEMISEGDSECGGWEESEMYKVSQIDASTFRKWQWEQCERGGEGECGTTERNWREKI
ncbi:hypothetical protein BLNAU_15240 [Blattamonas nauphoetae]|uniref:Uncharacterized protein n=1 Tax=Blattamonas nauphoetae TaxID=2049346 RepID=A0ABQ9XF50_9EUKA|nr:hypothetical protein BLNAU_15240 [Blattamonas nauphoetae]